MNCKWMKIINGKIEHPFIPKWRLPRANENGRRLFCRCFCVEVLNRTQGRQVRGILFPATVLVSDFRLSPWSISKCSSALGQTRITPLSPYWKCTEWPLSIAFVILDQIGPQILSGLLNPFLHEPLVMVFWHAPNLACVRQCSNGRPCGDGSWLLINRLKIWQRLLSYLYNKHKFSEQDDKTYLKITHPNFVIQVVWSFLEY
jgi:hypothetical protein